MGCDWSWSKTGANQEGDYRHVQRRKIEDRDGEKREDNIGRKREEVIWWEERERESVCVHACSGPICLSIFENKVSHAEGLEVAYFGGDFNLVWSVTRGKKEEEDDEAPQQVPVLHMLLVYGH